mmetsp:Transcript_70187/g.150308  ORF Transcript_70187/g.150308 Transcript_70187/m.150308 type:complete len:171 (+) Transcript_70187:50-562(+)
MGSARDYGGGFNTKGWASGAQAKGTFEFGEAFDEEAAKQIKPEKSLQELKDADLARFRNVKEKDNLEFEAAKSEAASKTRQNPQVSAAALAAAEKAARKRTLPGILQIKRRAGGGEAEDSAEAPAEKRAKGDDAGEVAPAAAPAAAAAGGSLLAGYASDSDDEDEEEEAA